MADRLVCVIYDKNDKPLAASYQHWNATGYKEMDRIIEKEISNRKSNNKKIDQYAAACILRDACMKFNGTDEYPICLELEHYNWSKNNGIPFSSDEEKKFAVLHPDINSDWSKASRSDGILCINREKIEDWLGWAEMVNDYEV